MNEIIPFGKYRGQPIDILFTDLEYTGWLLNQGWFSTRYPEIAEYISGKGVEPNDSPEHNNMQIRFLDKEYREKILRFAEVDRCLDKVAFELGGVDVVLYNDPRETVAIELKTSMGDDYPTVLRQIRKYRDNPILWDRYRLRPPRVWLLILKEFSSINITLDQVKAFFINSGVKLITEDELELL